ncbi:MAG TPA: peptide chain release factor 2 [Clostridiales bacterium]|nr:peptide chain release factor 2 [Clostridiales bacterium]
MIETDKYKFRIKELKESLAETGDALAVPKITEELKDIRAELEKPEVWGDLKKSQELSKKAAGIESKLNAFNKAEKSLADASDILELLEMEEDEETVKALEDELDTVSGEIESMKLEALLKGKYDSLNALMTLHAGAGGTEACDWTEMLYRMYIMYAEKMGYKVTELDRLDGDEAGIKNVSFKVEGENAYGYLKAEKGVHRLVRISPFDANKRRHTSFASLEVMPEIIDDGEIEIRPEDLKLDTFRSSGAGGQHINKTDSAVRITHIPTGIVVSCQNERSQTQNKEMCMRMLMSKLIEKRESERLEQEQSIKGEIKKIEWGSQIRSYVFCPYTLVKDHRTGYENTNVQAVMDGDIHGFICDYLKKSQS